jgi:2-polyprenyl-3-methyl-5-hydroxy-6-metoxy-1,4-benzoquinol methylase
MSPFEGSNYMLLPIREYCFTCLNTDRSIIWYSATMNLVVCNGCKSEWLEGHYPGDQAYSYADYDTNPTLREYSIGRAHRFVAYLQRFAAGPDLLDIGCGTGEFCHEAGKLGWKTVGVELTEDAAMVARTKSGLTVLAGDIMQEEMLPPASFDVVTLWGVLEHVPDPDGLLKACIRLLRPNGLILLETPNALALFRLVGRLLLKASLGHFDKAFLETLGGGHVVWYSPLGLRQAARRLGLEVMDLRSSRNSTRILLERRF